MLELGHRGKELLGRLRRLGRKNSNENIVRWDSKMSATCMGAGVRGNDDQVYIGETDARLSISIHPDEGMNQGPAGVKR